MRGGVAEGGGIFRRVGLVLAAGAVALFLLLGLGTWQLQRLAWKEHLLAQVAARVHAPAVEVPPLSAWPALSREQDEYRHVRARGVFDHQREALVYTGGDTEDRLPAGPGFFVITPLMRTDGPPILINRGFVPEARRDPATRAAGQITGEVEVSGLLRLPEQSSWFVPANDAAHGMFFRRDPASIAAARGLVDAAPFIIDADAGTVPGGLPAGGATRLHFPNRHLEYALTWYGLAAALVGVGLVLAWSGRRAGR